VPPFAFTTHHSNSQRMGLLSFFKRADQQSRTTVPGETVDAVQRARLRARQRLIGAAILLLIGVIGFPLVFETQPRPVPVDIPIEVPRREGAPALVMPPARSPMPAASASVAPRSAVAPEVITESREEAGRDMPAPASASASLPVTASPQSAAPAETRIAPKMRTAPAPLKPEPATKPGVDDAARAQSLLDGKKPTSEAARFVVQVGAFADVTAAREIRLKVEKLGLRTYTQMARTSAGNRIRVRMGPFGSRDEADKAKAKAKDAGLNAVVLTL
jgi:DedD protein